MPAVRGLEDYLRTLEIVEQRPLNELEHCIIGVDVFQWLRSNNFICSEALHSALGGLPLTLEHQVHKQLFKFHEWKIQPLFVFNGLKYSQNARAPFSSSRSRKYAAKRKQAWRAMETDSVERSKELFGQISGYVSVSAQDDLIRIFSRWNATIPQRNAQLRTDYVAALKEAESKDNEDSVSKAVAEPNYFKPISWFRAPYYAASQMAYLESQEEMLHAVCGGCDLLMFGGEKVILNIDFLNDVFETTDLDRVLFALKVDRSPYCFIDTCLLSGFDASRTFEPLTLNDLHSLSAESNSTKRGRSHRNFSYKYSLDQVLKKGNGESVIEEYLCTWNDAGSTSSWNSNYSAGTVASMQSTRSVRSVGGRSVKSFKSVRSAVNFRSYQQKTNQTLRGATGNIDQILQRMLGPTDESAAHQTYHKDGGGMGGMGAVEEEDEKNENPKYKEYQQLYRIVRDRVCNAKVMSFGGDTKIYRPFHWMNEQIEKQKAAQLRLQKTEDEKVKDDDEKHSELTDKAQGEGPRIVRLDDSVPSNAYRLLGVGVLSTFLPSAILGGHCIDTTPLIDSNELAIAMETTLTLRVNVCNILQNAFGTEASVSLQRWFQPNRDRIMEYDSGWITQWVADYKRALRGLFHDIDRVVDARASIALVTPLKMLDDIARKNKRKKGKSSKGGGGMTASGMPAVRHISQLLAAAYLGTLLTLKHVDSDCRMKGVAKQLSVLKKFEFETVLAVDMLQNGDLDATCFTLIDENGKEYKIDGPQGINAERMLGDVAVTNKMLRDQRSMRILTRCCCLLPMRPFTDGRKPWESQLSHSLAAFNHVSTAYYHGIKSCIEACITWLYCQIQHDAAGSTIDVDVEDTKETEQRPAPTPTALHQRAQRSNAIITSPSFLKELALTLKQLPPEPCTGMGVLIERFVTEFAKLDWNKKASALSDEEKSKLLEKQMDILRAAFPAFTRHQFAIQNCMQFFYQILNMVKQLGDADVLKAKMVLQFEDAYEFLKELGIWDAVYFMEVTLNKMRRAKESPKKKKAAKAAVKK